VGAAHRIGSLPFFGKECHNKPQKDKEMNYMQAKKIMTDLVPKGMFWSLELDCSRYSTSSHIKETRRSWLGDPIKKFFGDGITWQSAVDEALVALRNEGLIE